MAELTDVFKQKENEDAFDNLDDVSRELLKYGKTLDEWKQLEELDKEYQSARNYMQETQSKLATIESEMKRIEKDNEDKAKKAHHCHLQAKALYDKKEYDLAIDKWNEALEYVPTHQGSHYGIDEAKSRIREKEQQHLKEQKEKAQKLERAEEHFMLGKKYFLEDKFEAALIEMKEAIALGGREPRFLEAIKEAEDKIKRKNEEMLHARMKKEEERDKIQSLLLEGRKLIREKEFEKGIETLDKILLVDPQHKMALEEIRESENQQREWEAAQQKEQIERIAFLKQVREYQVKAMQYERSGDYEAAIEMHAKVLKTDPEQEKSLEEITRIQAYLKEEERKHLEAEAEALAKKEALAAEAREKEKREELAREEAAKEALENKRRLEEEQRKLQEKENAEKKYHYSQGVKYFSLGQYARAIESFDQVVIYDSSYEEIEDYLEKARLALAEEIQEKKERAEEEKRLILLKEEQEKKEKEQLELQIRDFFRRGLHFYDNAEYEKAIAEWQQALVLRRDDKGIKDEIEKARTKIEEQKEAERKKQQEERLAREEKARKDSLLRIYSDQAEVYYREGEYDKAIAEWKKVLEIDFSEAEAINNILKAERAIKEIERKQLEEDKKKQELKKQIQELTFRAEDMFCEELYDNAIKQWETILELDSLNKKAQEGLIKAKARKKEIEARNRAMEMARELIKKEEEKFKSMKEAFAEGERLYQEGEFMEAIRKWEKSMGKLI